MPRSVLLGFMFEVFVHNIQVRFRDTKGRSIFTTSRRDFSRPHHQNFCVSNLVHQLEICILWDWRLIYWLEVKQQISDQKYSNHNGTAHGGARGCLAEFRVGEKNHDRKKETKSFVSRRMPF